MSKMANLDLVLGEMIEAGQKMITAATELKAIFSGEKETVTPPVKEEVTELVTETPAKTYTFQDVRGIMARLSSNKNKEEAKALLTKYGADRLSAVKPEDYAALVADAEALLHG